MQQRFVRRDGSRMTLAQSKRANELQNDINRWEENRLVTSGIARYKEVLCNCHHEMAAGLRVGHVWARW